MTLDICVPYWGDPETFMRTIDSVRAQSDPHWRLVIIDDAYPGDAIERYVSTLDDHRIEYRRNEHNVGIIENFRRAVRAATGSHVVILGADDLLMPEYVAHIRSVIADDPSVDVIQPGVHVIDAHGGRARSLVDTVKLKLLTPRHPAILRGEEMSASLLRGNWLYWPSLALRVEPASAIGFRDDLPIILDLALLLDIASRGGSLRYTAVTCFAYRRHAASLSQTSLRDGSRFVDERRFYREAAAEAAARGWRRAARAARWRLMSRLHALSVLPGVVVRGSRKAAVAAAMLAFGD